MLNDRYLKLSSRRFVACPFTADEYGKVSPRAFKEFKFGTQCDGGYFATSIENSFPEIDEKVEFLNKLYQCLLCNQLQHKVRKLVVVGAPDSGKSSWANIFFGLIPRSSIAVLTKEQNFGASMINAGTELLYIDEWTDAMLSSDQVKTIFQGGYFAQSIKHKTPKMEEMNAGVFITCNNLPSFGTENDNVMRRLAVFETRTLAQKSIEAPEWIREHALECLVWMINVINSNIDRVSACERFYELPYNVKADTRTKQSLSNHDLDQIKSFEATNIPLYESAVIDENSLDVSFKMLGNHGKYSRLFLLVFHYIKLLVQTNLQTAE